MLQVLREKINDSRALKWGIVLGCAVMFAGGLWLCTGELLRPTPPDPAVTPANEIVTFITSPQWERINSAERETLLRGIANRYINMDPSDRQEFNRLWDGPNAGSGIQSRVQMQVETTMLRHLSEQYTQLPAAARTQYLDQTLSMIRAMPGGEDCLTWFTEDPVGQVLDHKADRMLGQWLAVTNARERASFAQFAHDLLGRVRQHP